MLCAAGAADFVGRKMGLCRVPHLLHELVVAGARWSRRVAHVETAHTHSDWVAIELAVCIAIERVTVIAIERVPVIAV